MLRLPRFVATALLLSLVLVVLLGLAGPSSFGSAFAAPAPLPEILRFEHYTSEDGLSQNAVFFTFQDSRGFLWIGTQDGLNRFDGYEFITYRSDPDNANSLGHSSVLCMAEDSSGTLWFGTWGGGLTRYDPRSAIFTRFTHQDGDSNSLSADVVSTLTIDRAGRLWVGTVGGGLDQLDIKTGQFKHYRNNPQDPTSLSSNAISTIVEDPSGALWIGTGALNTEGAGLNRFNPQTGKAQRFPARPDDPQGLSGSSISSIARDPSGALWIATGGYGLKGAGLNRFDPQTGRFTRFQHDPNTPGSLSSDNLTALYLDLSGSLWIGTWGGGLERLDTFNRNGGFIHYRNNPFNSSSLASDTIWSISQDRSGVLWIGTVLGGLNKINPQIQHFALYRHEPNNPQSLSGNSIGPMLEDKDGSIWIGTLGSGLNHFAPAQGTFTRFTSPSDEAVRQQQDTFLALVQDASGALWLGTAGGLGRLERESGQFRYWRNDPQNPDSLSSDNVGALALDSSGRLWVGTNAGLDLFDSQNNLFTHMNVPVSAPVIKLFKDRSGMIWAGTWGSGLFRIDPKTASGSQVKYTAYHSQVNEVNGLANDAVVDLYQSADGALWVATESGLDRQDPQTGSFTHLRSRDGLPGNNPLCVLEDEQGELWISTTQGIARYDPQARQVRVFDARDGLQGSEYDSGACLRSRDNRMYFGGTNGLSSFYPSEIIDNPLPPAVALTGFRIFNEPVQVDLSGSVPLKLDYQQNFFTFEFAALDFHVPQKNQYAYKLEGFDKDWVQLGSRRFASYTNINGGTYTFRVKASNNDGIWNETGISIPMIVTPPFWGTWWFRAVAALALIGLVGLTIRLRVSSVEGQNRKLESLVGQRTAELTGMNKLLEEEISQREHAEEELSHRAAEELQQSEARFISMYEHAEVGILLTSIDRRFVRGNPAVQRMFGYSEAELQQLDPRVLVHSEDLDVDTEKFHDLSNGRIDAYGAEKRYLRKDGSIFWGRLNYSLVRGPDGSPRLAIGIIEDISEEKRSAEALQQSEARFRAMFDNAAVGMALITLDRKMIQINQSAARITGYSVDELMRMDPADLMVDEDRKPEDIYFHDLLANHIEAYQSEKRYTRKSGEVFWARLTYSCVRGPDGEPRYFIGMIEDIDEQKRSDEKLAAQEAEHRRSLEARVEERTHRLRQANLLLQQEIEQRQKIEAALAQKAADEAVLAERNRLARDLHDAVTQTLFAASLIAEVLPGLWKMDPAEAIKSTEELRQLTRGALAEMRTLLLELRPAALTQTRYEDLLRQLIEAVVGRARLPIELRVEGQRKLLPEVQVALYRIAQESLNNIVKYARASQVWIDLNLSPAGVLLTIRDNGVGFDPASVRPTSMGLKIMRERAEEIGANFDITSTPGKGTQVEITWEDPDVKEELE